MADPVAERGEAHHTMRVALRTRLSVAALFTATGAALVVYILAGMSLLGTLLTALALVAAIGALAWRRAARAKRALMARYVRAGVIAGLVATPTYDVARFLLVRVTGMPFWPFDIFEIFGQSLIGSDHSRLVLNAVGYTYHMLNGLGFAVAYTILIRRRNALTGVLWGLFLEAFQLTLYPGWLSMRAWAEFAQVSVFGHIIYGAVLGALSARLLKGVKER